VDILERAEGVDPTGQRTIGVLTKCDLIGPGAEDEVLEVVNNRRKPLALGYTMVKNRSQKEMKDGTSSAKARYVIHFFTS
jgi:interferon-induced GTP-binding protein Mx1